jgi:hypothetical protein
MKPIFTIPARITDKDHSNRNQMMAEIQFAVLSWRARGLSEVAIEQVMKNDCPFLYQAEFMDLESCRYSRPPEAIQ